jgi:hypothetical protein
MIFMKTIEKIQAQLTTILEIIGADQSANISIKDTGGVTLVLEGSTGQPRYEIVFTGKGELRFVYQIGYEGGFASKFRIDVGELGEEYTNTQSGKVFNMKNYAGGS